VAKKSKSKFDPEAFLAKADGGVTISRYRKGQVVFNQGDPADSVFYIREGRVKIAVVSAQGKEAVVAFLKAGDFIGEGLSDRTAATRFDRQGLGGLHSYPG
jgi:CRP/FNR family cyclic AMP-dependent transcriptional regulator